MAIAVSLALASPLVYAQPRVSPAEPGSDRREPAPQPGEGLRLRLDYSLAFPMGASDGASVQRELAAQAQPQSQPQDQPQPEPPRKPPARPPRLSDWLLRQKPSETAYLLGLSWRVAEEVPPQKSLQLELLSALGGADKQVRADPRAMQRVGDWIAALPITGRVLIPVPDARWLEANPTRDPIIRPGHTVVIPQRPRTVTVITGEGKFCKVNHTAGHEARSYLAACGIGVADWAWIAQPDGKVQRYGVAVWNKETQDEPAAGAWIWAPARRSGWPDRFSEGLIRFLATQGPAPDELTVSPHPNPIPADGEREPGGQAEGFSTSFGSRTPEHPNTVVSGPSAPLSVRSDELPSKSRGLEVSSSDWGGVGLLQTPTARMRSTGTLSFHWGRIRPYTNGNVFFQPFDWMEAGFRYTDIADIPYGGPGSVLEQSNKDKSIDLKLRIWPESAYVPQIAIGLRDVGGTGLFAGEYVVANKRTGDFDWSLGIGWGYVGGRGNIRNPLSRLFGESFDRRTGVSGQGGELAWKSYFRGPTALFGGVQYQTPWESLLLKAEYDGNDYRNEPFRPLSQDSPFNFGIVYRATRGVDLTLGFERGNKLMFGVTLHSQLNRLTQPKLSDPRPVPISVARPSKAPDWNATTRELERQTDWHVRSIEQREGEVRVVVDDADAVYWRYRVDRAAGVLHRDAPATVNRFTLTYRQRGVDIAEHAIDREAWVADKTQRLPPGEQRETVIARAPQVGEPGQVIAQSDRPAFEHGFGVHYGQVLGGPDAFVLYQIFASERARLRLRDDTWLQGGLRLRIIDNYEKFRVTGPSNLPRARTFQREYLTTSRVTMPHLQLTHVGKLSENQYYSVYGGYLEEMFGGVGAEWLYRPFASRLAYGVDINEVRQREFSQGFGFRDYRTTTGHGTVYWDTGWNDVIATLKAGRYLAGDVGATLDVSRVFKNGVRVGAFATKTNVSAQEFGEGSFDKGVYIIIPFDAMFTRSSNSVANILWRPLTRDGGAILARQSSLYSLTSARSDRTLQREPAPLPNERLIPADRRDEWQPQVKGPEPYTRVTPKKPAEQWQQPGAMDEHRLVQALYKQQFRNIEVSYDGSHRLMLALANDEIRPISRAVGRAARTALQLAPLDAREIIITFAERANPVVKYEFFDLKRLQRYFEGEINGAELKDYVKVEWLNPARYEKDPLARLDDLDPQAKPSLVRTVMPETFSVSRVANDFVSAGSEAAKIDWLKAGVVGAGLVLSSSMLDNRAHRFARDHAGSRWLTDGVRLGNAIPWVGFAAAGALALDGSDPRRSRTGYAAVEAGATAFAVATGLKYVVGRARPTTGLSRTTFEWGTREDSFHSFPSRHTSVAWALATPFALEYDMPWLYGVAALTNLSRVGSREHWLSDTVASSAIGYGLGRLFWQSGRDQAKGEPKVFFDGSGLGMLWGW